jgi:hypothetical protein
MELKQLDWEVMEEEEMVQLMEWVEQEAQTRVVEVEVDHTVLEYITTVALEDLELSLSATLLLRQGGLQIIDVGVVEH